MMFWEASSLITKLGIVLCVVCSATVGSDHNQKIWAVQCTQDGCGHVYGVNGSDFHERRCPKCQSGAPGI